MPATGGVVRKLESQEDQEGNYSQRLINAAIYSGPNAVNSCTDNQPSFLCNIKISWIDYSYIGYIDGDSAPRRCMETENIRDQRHSG